MDNNKKIEFYKNHMEMLKSIIDGINEKMQQGLEGIKQNDANLCIGGVFGMEDDLNQAETIIKSLLIFHKNKDF